MDQHSPGKRVIGVGLACLDQLLIWNDTSAPVQDNRINGFTMQGGGMAATAMVTVSRLGGEAELWAIVDDDWIGEEILRELVAEGVDITQVTKVPATGSLLMLVCVDGKSGERYFLATGDWTRPDIVVGDLARLTDAGCLLIDRILRTSELRAAREAKKVGIPVVCDTRGPTDLGEIDFTYVDYAIVSEEAAKSLNDDLQVACQMIRNKGAGVAVITRGENGLVYMDELTFRALPAFSVDVVDTTGAGDVFHGAFCYGLVQGLALKSNLLFASAVSALKCRVLGGRTGIPGTPQVKAFLQEHNVQLDYK